MRLIIGNVQSPASPLLRAVSLLVGAILFVIALVFGAVLLAFIIGLGVILAAVVMVRMWWIGRKMRNASGATAFDPGMDPGQFRRARAENPAGSRVIEGECTDVSESHEERERDESR